MLRGDSFAHGISLLVILMDAMGVGVPWGAKKKRTPTYMCRTHPKSTHPLRGVFFPLLFLGAFPVSRCQALLSNWSFKTKNEKGHAENVLQKNEKNSMSFSP
jgi:hypothetical protein